MNNQESEDQQQDRQRKERDLLRSEREVRGEMRDAHLKTGREQARSDNALAREGSPALLSPVEDAGGDYEAELTARKEAVLADAKAEARSRYEGSDEDFEQNWPQIKEQLIAEMVEKDLKEIRRRL